PATPGPVPVLPGQGAQTTAAIPLPGPQPVPATVGGKPQVEHYDVYNHVCTPADTDFETLSKKFYEGSDRYAQALIEYNKDGAGQPPRLTPGARVMVPPTHVLESKFPNAVAGLKPVQGVAPKSFDPGPAAPPKNF